MVARLGGDEFMVLCAGADQAGATITAGRIRGALAAPFDVAGQRRHIRVSIGCRVAGADETDPEALLRDADTAMYQAKESGKDRVELFSDATRARILRRIELEQHAARRARERASWRSTTSRRSTSPAAGWSASRRSCAGARPRPPSSSRSPRRPG